MTATISPRTQAGPAALSYPQERLFLLDRIMPGVPAYNVPRLMRVRATLDPGALQRALDAIVGRHDILRTRVRLEGGTPVQEVAAHGRVELVAVDLSDHPEADREREGDRIIAELATRPFVLSADVPLRAALVQMADDDARLLVVSHHIASDHSSGAVLISELDALYSAFAAGQPAELPDLPVQYADFAAWQREELAGPLRDELLAYWTQQLTGAPPALALPADRPRPATQTYRGAIRELGVDPALAARLRTVARSSGVSMFMLLLAAFDTLMYRYTGEEDVVVGVPVSGRHHEETLPLVGYFSNTLAVRSDLAGDPRFSDLLAQVRETVLGAQIHQELPFELVVEALNPPRSPSRSPIFQVLFGFDVAAAQEPTLAGVPLEELPVPGWAYARFDLSLVLRERPDGSLVGQLEYSTDLFEAATIERTIGHLRTLLSAIAQDPARRLSQLDMLAPAELEALRRSTATARAQAPARLEALVAEQAARRPEAVAVVSEAERLSYGELDRRANRLARELGALGVEPGGRVAVCTDRSADLVVALLGVLKAGATYVPIDPAYPPDRQGFILTDAGASVLITQRRLLNGLVAGAAAALELDVDWPRIVRHEPTPPAIEADADQAAYVIYTSGSTGRPKGVAVSHRSVANLMAQMRRAPGLDERDVVVNLTTPAFDLSVPDWFLPLTSGARLFVVPHEVTLDPDELAARIAQAAGTFMQATPTTWQLLVDSGWTGSAGLKIVCGGEPLSRVLADALLERGAELWHMYGPTETTVWSSILRLEAGEGPPPLGGPIDNTQFHVVDRDGRLVPTGVPGELLIGGAGVALGYHGRPDLTAERFVPDGFGGDPGARLYRTGDLVRRRSDGTLEFAGRADQQVKLRGFRIELGEIEAVLAAHPGVAAAVAVVREDVPGDRRLVAYVVSEGERAPAIQDLRQLARGRLPQYMVPSAFVMLDALPVTANRKLDRAALPAPSGARPDTGQAFAAPSTPVEEALAAIWREILGLDRVGVDDHFFGLGGHSLSAVAMLARVHDELGVDLFLGVIFETPSIRGLAETVTHRLLSEAGDEDLLLALAEVEAAES